MVRRSAARRDLLEIWSYVAEHDMDAADRLIVDVEHTIDFLADHPRAGASKQSRITELRSFVVGRYVLFYQPIEGGIRLIRVLHGSRDVSRALHR